MRVLLDTSFIFPTLGIGVKPDVTRALQDLAHGNVETRFSSFSLLESLWQAAKLKKSATFDEKRFLEGVKSILDSGAYLRSDEGFEVYRKATEVAGMGHRDMIDNILYANSVTNGLKFLTVDQELRSFVREHGLEDSTVFPSEMRMFL